MTRIEVTSGDTSRTTFGSLQVGEWFMDGTGRVLVKTLENFPCNGGTEYHNAVRIATPNHNLPTSGWSSRFSSNTFVTRIPAVSIRLHFDS